jgi:hypothetical protein
MGTPPLGFQASSVLYRTNARKDQQVLFGIPNFSPSHGNPQGARHGIRKATLPLGNTGGPLPAAGGRMPAGRPHAANSVIPVPSPPIP